MKNFYIVYVKIGRHWKFTGKILNTLKDVTKEVQYVNEYAPNAHEIKVFDVNNMRFVRLKHGN